MPATDNCGITELTLDKTAFTCSDLGTSTVMLTVKDAAGNTNACLATITVLDLLPPTINYPASVTTNTTGQCSQNVYYTASAEDNCLVAPWIANR